MVIVISGINEQENFPSDNQQHCHHESYRFKTHTRNALKFLNLKKIEWIIIKFVFVFISNFHMNWNENEKIYWFQTNTKNDYLYNSFEFAWRKMFEFKDFFHCFCNLWNRSITVLILFLIFPLIIFFVDEFLFCFLFSPKPQIE